MEEWYKKQDFFEEKNLERIMGWTKGDKIEFISDMNQHQLSVA